MKRYFMQASNGSVVPHESPIGRWVDYDDFLEQQAKEDAKRECRRAEGMTSDFIYRGGEI